MRHLRLPMPVCCCARLSSEFCHDLGYSKCIIRRLPETLAIVHRQGRGAGLCAYCIHVLCMHVARFMSQPAGIHLRPAWPGDADRDGVIGPEEAPLFFRPSGLPGDVLSKIWRLSASQNALRSPVRADYLMHLRFAMLTGCGRLEHHAKYAGI